MDVGESMDMDEYGVDVGNQEILCKYMVPLSSALFAKQLVYLVEPGLCDLPSYLGFYNKSPAQYSGLAKNVIRLGPMALFQQGKDPATGRDMLFRVTTFEKEGVKKEDVICGINTVAIGYRYIHDPKNEDAPIIYGKFHALSEGDLADFSDGVIVCLVEMASGDSGAEVVRADSRYAYLSNNLLRSNGFWGGVGLSPALPGSGVGEAKSTVMLRRGNAYAAGHEESVFDASAGLVKRRVVEGVYDLVGRAAGVYVFGCTAFSETAVGDGPLPMVCSGGGVDWFAEVTEWGKEAALEAALQKVPFGVVIFGAVYWDGVSLLTSEFFPSRRTFADVVGRFHDALEEAKDFAQGLNDERKAEFDEHAASKGDESNFSHVKLDPENKHGLSLLDGLLGLGVAGEGSFGSVKVPSGNGLSVLGGVISLANAIASSGGSGGSAGAMEAKEKEKLNGIASGAEVNVQSNWSESNASSDGFIQNKPSSFPPSSHSHAYSEVTGKPSSFPPSSHSHAYSEVTGKPSSFPPSSHSHAYSEVTGKPSSFPPSSHSHSMGDIINLGFLVSDHINFYYESSRAVNVGTRKINLPECLVGDVVIKFLYIYDDPYNGVDTFRVYTPLGFGKYSGAIGGVVTYNHHSVFGASFNSVSQDSEVKSFSGHSSKDTEILAIFCYKRIS
jgi:hypothetical protein